MIIIDDKWYYDNNDIYDNIDGNDDNDDINDTFDNYDTNDINDNIDDNWYYDNNDDMKYWHRLQSHFGKVWITWTWCEFSHDYRWTDIWLSMCVEKKESLLLLFVLLLFVEF